MSMNKFKFNDATVDLYGVSKLVKCSQCPNTGLLVHDQ